MLPSSSPPLTKKGEKTPRSNVPSRQPSPTDELLELSDVPCYTCRRRHVKCDRILPSCAKCKKKGVPCLGYQKPLRWADGVAVRGKLKGKSQPVLDSNVVSIVRNNVQLQASSAIEEAAHFGVHATDNCCNEVVADESQLLDLMTYHNTTICAERVTFKESKFINRHIAPLSKEAAQRLPKSIVNCILGIAAVHMASRHPGNRALERLALEAKVNVFQSHNYLLQTPQRKLDQQPDVIIASGILIFAMDLIEHGMSRWMVHTLGCMQVMASFGGIENLFFYYPHLHVPLFHLAHFETSWIILSHIPSTKAKQTSRKALEMLCHASLAKQKIYNPCPTPLLLSMWDIGACAQKILWSPDRITYADMRRREQILLDLISYRTEDAMRAVKEDYYKDVALPEARLKIWDLISKAWKAAITILAVRYLFFGRPNLVPPAQARQSPTSSLQVPSRGGTPFMLQDELSTYNPSIEDFDLQEFVDESGGEDDLPDYLSAGLYFNDVLSRSPSPMPSPLPYTDPYAEPPSLDFWDRRYEIHDEAFSVLSANFTTLHETLDPSCLRYIIVPLMILALVSRSHSHERALCLSFFAKFKAFMANPSASAAAGSPSPLGGEELEFEVPWEKLDAYSEIIERQMQNQLGLVGSMQPNSAPEWNWWDMLKQLDLNLAWPITSGMSHFERGSEFWAFQLMSSVVNDECFNVWLNGSNSPQSSWSSA